MRLLNPLRLLRGREFLCQSPTNQHASTPTNKQTNPSPLSLSLSLVQTQIMHKSLLDSLRVPVVAVSTFHPRHPPYFGYLFDSHGTGREKKNHSNGARSLHQASSCLVSQWIPCTTTGTRTDRYFILRSICFLLPVVPGMVPIYWLRATDNMIGLSGTTRKPRALAHYRNISNYR